MHRASACAQLVSVTTRRTGSYVINRRDLHARGTTHHVNTNNCRIVSVVTPRLQNGFHCSVGSLRCVPAVADGTSPAVSAAVGTTEPKLRPLRSSTAAEPLAVAAGALPEAQAVELSGSDVSLVARGRRLRPVPAGGGAAIMPPGHGVSTLDKLHAAALTWRRRQQTRCPARSRCATRWFCPLSCLVKYELGECTDAQQNE